MEQLPILPLGQLVVYPHVVLPLALTDPNAVQLIDEVVRGNKRLLLGVVKPVGGAEPVEGAVMQARADELYEVGTLGSVVRMLKLGDGSVRVMVQGLERARLVEISPGPHWLVASYTTFSSEHTEDARTEALKRTVHAQFSRVIDIAPYLGEELHEVLAGITDAGKLADRSEEHTSELQSRLHLVCRLLLEKKKNILDANSNMCKIREVLSHDTT